MGSFLFIGENSTAVCKELVGDTVSCENLMENVVIAIQSFLGIKPTAGNPSCSIIYSQMQMPYLSGVSIRRELRPFAAVHRNKRLWDGGNGRPQEQQD